MMTSNDYQLSRKDLTLELYTHVDNYVLQTKLKYHESILKDNQSPAKYHKSEMKYHESESKY